MMQERMDASPGGMQEKDECRTGGMQEKDGCRTRGIQDRKDYGEVQVLFIIQE